MNYLDRPMEFLIAGVFMFVGLKKIFGYQRRPRALGASDMRLMFGLPYGAIVAVGLFEILAALALVMPFSPIPQANLVRFAATGLALLTSASCVYHVRRHESAEKTVALFLLSIFIIVGRSI